MSTTQAELDFMHNFRHETDGAKWAKNRIEELEKERDQLREQIASLKDELRQISTAIDDVRLDLTNTATELITEMKEQLASRDAEVAKLKAKAIDHEVKHDVAVNTILELIAAYREAVAALSDPALYCSDTTYCDEFCCREEQRNALATAKRLGVE